MQEIMQRAKAMKYGYLILFPCLMGCDSPIGLDFPPDRQKQLVSVDDYLSEDACWGGVGLQKEGTWIPVEFAVDSGANFTMIGVVSRTCELMTVVDFEREAGKVPGYFPFESHASYFEFVTPSLIDPDNLFGDSELRTPASSNSFIYSDKVKFFDGYIMLGPPVAAKAGGPDFFNVVKVKR